MCQSTFLARGIGEEYHHRAGFRLTLGRQGPTVHVGAALAAQLSRWVPTSPITGVK